MLQQKIFSDFLSQKQFDIRITHNGRWIDQKVTPDVLSFVAQSILQYTETKNVKKFTNKELYSSDVVVKTASQFFGKPATSADEMGNEYNKFVGQPLKTLSSAGILNEDSTKRPYQYSVNEPYILELIAQSDKNALIFLQVYIEKTLNASDFTAFQDFFKVENPDNGDFIRLRDKFVEFEQDNTSITQELEPRRILAKVLNPLAFEFGKFGAKHGRISKELIRYSDLTYDGENSQDAGKVKSMSRQEFRELPEHSERTFTYRITKAIQAVRHYNDRFNNGKSETGSKETGTDGHHMLPKGNDNYVEFADYPENIIMLSPNEHYLSAHNDHKTQQINPEFQHKLLEIKREHIIQSLKNHEAESPYSSDRFNEIIGKYNKLNSDVKSINFI